MLATMEEEQLQVPAMLVHLTVPQLLVKLNVSITSIVLSISLNVYLYNM